MPLGAIGTGVAAGVAGAATTTILGSVLAPDAPSSTSASSASDAQSAIANDQYAFYKANFQPLEKSLISEVATAGDAAEQERAAGLAHGDITNAFDAARRNDKMRAMTYGLNPASGRFGSMELGRSTGEAAADADAQNAARIQARELGFQKRSNVAQTGRNIPSQAITGLSSAANTGLMAFNQQAFLGQQAREGLAPIVGPIGKGVSDAVSNWFNTKPGLQPSFGTETFQSSSPTITTTPGGTTEFWG